MLKISRIKRGWVVLVTAMVLVLAACSPETEQPIEPQGDASDAETEAQGAAQPPPTDNTIEGTVWMLERMGGEVILASGPITLQINEDGTLAGSSGCNNYGGEYTLSDGEQLTVGNLFQTEMACMEEGVMEQESRYLSLLNQAEMVSVSGGELIITTAADEELVFMAAEEETPATLEGPTWVLNAIEEGDAVSSTVAGSTVTLMLADGTLRGDAGCNGYGAGYTLEGDTISVDEIEQTLQLCEDEALMAQEEAYLAALTEAESFTIEGQTLRITSGETVLIFEQQAQPAPTRFDNTSWTLTTLDEGLDSPTTIEAVEVTLNFAAGQINGSAGCNTYNANYTLEGETLTITNPTSTRMMCEENIMQVESQFLGLLAQVNTFVMEGEMLRLVTPTGASLTFAPQPAQ